MLQGLGGCWDLGLGRPGVVPRSTCFFSVDGSKARAQDLLASSSVLPGHGMAVLNKLSVMTFLCMFPRSQSLLSKTMLPVFSWREWLYQAPLEGNFVFSVLRSTFLTLDPTASPGSDPFWARGTSPIHLPQTPDPMEWCSPRQPAVHYVKSNIGIMKMLRLLPLGPVSNEKPPGRAHSLRFYKQGENKRIFVLKKAIFVQAGLTLEELCGEYKPQKKTAIKMKSSACKMVFHLLVKCFTSNILFTNSNQTDKTLIFALCSESMCMCLSA